MRMINRLIGLSVLLLTAGIVLLSGCATTVQPAHSDTTSVVLLRHAERTGLTKLLTEAGHARARALPEAIADLPVVAIYSPNLTRNIDTARPLAEHLNIEITLVEDDANWEQVAQRLVSDHPGKTVLWVGNRGNLIQLYALLGGQGDPPLEYGQISILHVTRNQATASEERHFGNRFFN